MEAYNDFVKRIQRDALHSKSITTNDCQNWIKQLDVLYENYNKECFRLIPDDVKMMHLEMKRTINQKMYDSYTIAFVQSFY